MLMKRNSYKGHGISVCRGLVFVLISVYTAADDGSYQGQSSHQESSPDIAVKVYERTRFGGRVI